MFPAGDCKQSPGSPGEVSPVPGLSTPTDRGHKKAQGVVQRQELNCGQVPTHPAQPQQFSRSPRAGARRSLPGPFPPLGTKRERRASGGVSGGIGPVRARAGARRCPRLPGLRVPAAALTRRSSRAPSARRAIAPSPPAAGPAPRRQLRGVPASAHSAPPRPSPRRPSCPAQRRGPGCGRRGEAEPGALGATGAEVGSARRREARVDPRPRPYAHLGP